MHSAASAFLQRYHHHGRDGGKHAPGPPPLPPLLAGVAKQLPKVAGLDVAEGWDPPTRTLPWAPVSVWEGSAMVDDVDARKVSMADIVDKCVRPCVLACVRACMRACVRA